MICVFLLDWLGVLAGWADGGVLGFAGGCWVAGIVAHARFSV